MIQRDPKSVTPQTFKPGRKLIWPVFIVVLMIGAFTFFLLNVFDTSDSQNIASSGGQGSRNKHDQPTAVAVETVVKGDFPVYLSGLGTVTALRTVTVRPRVDGELVNITFNEGQMVQKGDLLAEIDPRTYQIQLAQAVGQLLRDEALLKNAEIDRSRYQTLLEQDSIAAQQTATQEAQVKQYRGTVKMDKAQVDNAKLQLSYAKVTAPISGRVGLRLVDQGNIVHAGDTEGLVVITQLQPISVVFSLPEDKVQAVVRRWHSAEPLAVSAYDRIGTTVLAKGTLVALDNQIDASTGTFKLRAQFDNTDNTLFVNQFVNVEMLVDTEHDAILVASAAIQHDNQGSFVFVVNSDKTVQMRRITTGSSNADKTVVLEHLAANEMVVVEGTDRLSDGSRVDIAKKDGQMMLPDAEQPSNAGKQPRRR